VILGDDELAAIRRQAEAEYPAECCGVVLAKSGDAAERRVYPCRNIQDALHARDPGRFPRDARTAYYIAHEDLLEIGRQETRGFGVDVIYHSHVDVGAYFSETDRQQALFDGEPAYPAATYVVVGVNGGRADETRAFRWDPRAGDFVEVSLAEE
jgi:adenylyltransferase/sulfurtransferase